MNLRARLIVAFLVLSVGPLGAVTYFSFTSQVRAVRDLASREADALSTEMTARMQLVTAELSARVEQLADIDEPPVVRVTQRAATAPKSNASATARALDPAVTGIESAVPEAQTSDQVRAAEALGAAAMLLQTVELKGMRRTRTQDSPGTLQGQGGRGTRRGNPPAPVAAVPPPEVPDATPGAPSPPPAPDKVVIDMGAIARDLFSKYVPEGGVERMTSEQRQQLAREVNSRMLGIAEGIRISSEQLKKKADEVKELAASRTVPAPVPDSPTTVAPASRKATTRTTRLVGNRLDVTVREDGKVVGEVNATIDLENVLATVFSPTRRAQGEVPFAIAPDGKVYTANDADRRAVQELGTVVRPDAPLGKAVLPDWIVFTTSDPSGSGLRFGIARPVGDSLDDLRRTAGRNAGFGLLLIGIAIIGVVPISGRLTRNLTALTDGVGRIAQGDYRARVAVRSRDEIGDLAQAFNNMAADVERHQAAAIGQERLRRELELGRQIQSDMLPNVPLSFGRTHVRGVSLPAREVGGDFFNYFSLDDDRIALLIGDVSGKGVGAALLMANMQASLRTRLTLGQSLADIAEALDRDMASTSGSRLYVTLFLGILGVRTHRLQYVNAGHNPQFVLRSGRPLEGMAATGIPIGLLAGRGYTQREVLLATGDLLFFYTDGCVELENEANDVFGTERLEQVVLSAGTPGEPTPDRVLRHVEDAMIAFRGAREPNDDATMMGVSIG